MKIIGKFENVFYHRYDILQTKLRKHRREILIFLEHYPVITAGVNHNIKNLLVSEDFLNQNQIQLMYIKRGGDFTAHENGQLIIYPHIDLTKRNISISRYMNLFIESIQSSIESTWNLKLIYNPEKPGLYLKDYPSKKLVSIGISFKSMFTSFGAAINIKNTKNVFQYIHPCGQNYENIITISELNLNTNIENSFIQIFCQKFLFNLDP